MKKVIISLAVVLGIASAAYAFTPAETPQEETPAINHTHNHAHELNADEGHQHAKEASIYIWECQRCGKKFNTRDSRRPGVYTPNGCPAHSNHEHAWVLVGSVD